MPVGVEPGAKRLLQEGEACRVADPDGAGRRKDADRLGAVRGLAEGAKRLWQQDQRQAVVQRQPLGQHHGAKPARAVEVGEAVTARDVKDRARPGNRARTGAGPAADPRQGAHGGQAFAAPEAAVVGQADTGDRGKAHVLMPDAAAMVGHRQRPGMAGGKARQGREAQGADALVAGIGGCVQEGDHFVDLGQAIDWWGNIRLHPAGLL